MRTAAPGKLVLSGAYAVLEGAPALVCSVSAYAIADGARHPARSSPELRAAFGRRRPPLVDTSSMRRGTEKLGLGSSAAVVVAAVALDVWRRLPEAEREAERSTIAARSMRAHREAQGGGSGIDVLASTYGGFLVCRTGGAEPEVRPATWPADVSIRAYFLGHGASTKDFLAKVRALDASQPGARGAAFAEIARGARRVEDALAGGDAEALLAGLREQQIALRRLGEAAGCDIVPDRVRKLDAIAEGHGAVVATTGAGGGDIAVALSRGPIAGALDDALAQAGLALLPLQLGVPGVRVLPSDAP